jgi:hypothetical protein
VDPGRLSSTASHAEIHPPRPPDSAPCAPSIAPRDLGRSPKLGLFSLGYRDSLAWLGRTGECKLFCGCDSVKEEWRNDCPVLRLPWLGSRESTVTSSGCMINDTLHEGEK